MLRQLPCRGCDGNDHLDLAKAGTVGLHAVRELAVFLLQREEDQVIVTCYGAGSVWSHCVVDSAFLGCTLHPNAAVNAAFEQNWIGIWIDLDDVSLKCLERCLVDVHQGFVVGRESSGLAGRI